MLDASGFQFAFVFPQFGYDCGLVHATALFIFSRISKSTGIIDFGVNSRVLLSVGPARPEETFHPVALGAGESRGCGDGAWFG
jgi:hypothetical protein